MSKRDLLRRGYEQREKEESAEKRESTPVDELLENDETIKSEIKIESSVEKVNEDIDIEEAEIQPEPDEKRVLFENKNSSSISETEKYETQNINSALIANIDSEVAKKEETAGPLPAVVDFNNFVTTEIPKRRTVLVNDIVYKSLTLRYSEDDDKFIRIESAKHEITMTEFILAIIKYYRNEIEDEFISDEQFEINALEGKTYDRSRINHRFVLPEDIIKFLRRESARRGCGLPNLTKQILQMYKRDFCNK